jgi:hypothetical protein
LLLGADASDVDLLDDVVSLVSWNEKRKIRWARHNRVDGSDVTFAQDLVNDAAASFAELLQEGKIGQLGVSHLKSLLGPIALLGYRGDIIARPCHRRHDSRELLSEGKRGRSRPISSSNAIEYKNGSN